MNKNRGSWSTPRINPHYAIHLFRNFLTLESCYTLISVKDGCGLEAILDNDTVPPDPYSPTPQLNYPSHFFLILQFFSSNCFRLIE